MPATQIKTRRGFVVNNYNKILQLIPNGVIIINRKEGIVILVQFNVEKFAQALKKYRGKRPQSVVAAELNINRATVSLLENAKQVPTLKILQEFCNHAGLSPDSFFKEEEHDLTTKEPGGNFSTAEQIKLGNVLKRIEIREKYLLLNRRSE